MPLIDLQTSLKDLRYGYDRPGGGSSNQPYIANPIPTNNSNPQDLNIPGTMLPGNIIKVSKNFNIDIPDINIPGLNVPGVLNTPDFLIRGGIFSVVNSGRDVLRLGSYFLDLKSPSGLLFTLKQNLLSRVAVRTETSGFLNDNFYLPTNTLTQAALNAFGSHVPKQGILPLPGFRTFFGKDTYENVVEKRKDQVGGDIRDPNDPTDTNDPINVRKLTRNRLVALYRIKISGQRNRKNINGLIIDKDHEQNVLEYRGGPDSILGIGRTKLRLSDTVPIINNQGKDLTGSGDQTNREDIVFADKPDKSYRDEEAEDDADENAKRRARQKRRAERKAERENKRADRKKIRQFKKETGVDIRKLEKQNDRLRKSQRDDFNIGGGSRNNIDPKDAQKIARNEEKIFKAIQVYESKQAYNTFFNTVEVPIPDSDFTAPIPVFKTDQLINPVFNAFGQNGF